MTHAPDVLGAGFASTFSVAKYLLVVVSGAGLLIGIEQFYLWRRYRLRKPRERKVRLVPVCPRCREELIGAKRPRLCGQCADHREAA